MTDAAALIKIFLLRYLKTFEIIAVHISTDIPESTQHQSLLGILLVLPFGEILFISINLSKLLRSVGLNLTYKQSKMARLFHNVQEIKHTVFALYFIENRNHYCAH